MSVPRQSSPIERNLGKGAVLPDDEKHELDCHILLLIGSRVCSSLRFIVTFSHFSFSSITIYPIYTPAMVIRSSRAVEIDYSNPLLLLIRPTAGPRLTTSMHVTCMTLKSAAFRQLTIHLAPKSVQAVMHRPMRWLLGRFGVSASTLQTTFSLGLPATSILTSVLPIGKLQSLFIAPCSST